MASIAGLVFSDYYWHSDVAGNCIRWCCGFSDWLHLGTAELGSQLWCWGHLYSCIDILREFLPGKFHIGCQCFYYRHTVLKRCLHTSIYIDPSFTQPCVHSLIHLSIHPFIKKKITFQWTQFSSILISEWLFTVFQANQMLSLKIHAKWFGPGSNILQ